MTPREVWWEARTEPGLPGSTLADTDSAVVVVDSETGDPMPVQLVDPRTLRPQPAHPPIFDDARYRAGRAVMAERGMRVPLIVNKHGTVIDGNRRLATALELGLPLVPVVVVSPAKIAATAKRLGLSRAERRFALRRAGR